eukprot:280690-Rhodomonas_salina.1
MLLGHVTRTGRRHTASSASSSETPADASGRHKPYISTKRSLIGFSREKPSISTLDFPCRMARDHDCTDSHMQPQARHDDLSPQQTERNGWGVEPMARKTKV